MSMLVQAWSRARFVFVRRRPLWRAGRLETRVLACVLALASVGAGAAQGSPSGEYGEVALGSFVEGTLAPAAGDGNVVYHTYTVTVPPGTAPVTMHVESIEGEIDLAVNIGRPILDYGDVDHIDVTEDDSPSHTLPMGTSGTVWIDVINLTGRPSSYRLSVRTAEGSPSPPVSDGGNPLGAGGSVTADPLIGTFSGDGLTVQIDGNGGRYAGELELDGQRYPFEASGDGRQLAGVFVADGGSFEFTATLAGDALTVVSGGASFRTTRIGGQAQPVAPNPLDARPAAAQEPVIAQGAHASLTEDNARAFVEALEFSLQQAGFVATFSDVERTQIVQAIAQNFTTLGPSDQAILAQARDVWSRVEANWSSASPAEQREFIMGVFILAFGPEAVQQAAQSGGGAGGGGACATIDDCMSSYADPQTYQDTVNTQGCWAAAGCSGYDPVDNSFSYDTYE